MIKKEEQYEMRKYQILDISLTHFIWYGFYRTSIRKIAEEAGISSGLMFHYFLNKLSLYEALVEIECEKLTIAGGENELPLVFFERQIEWFLAVAAQMIKAHDIASMSVPYIKKGQESGVIREGDPS